MVAPILDKLAKEYAGQLVIAKVNTDENSQWAMQFGVQGIPTMLFCVRWEIVSPPGGALPEPLLRTVLGQFLDVVKKPQPQV